MSIARFDHDSLPQRVHFGSGAAAQNLAAEVALLGVSRIMVISAPDETALAKHVAGTLPVVHWHDEVVMHVPTEVAQRAADIAVRHRADVLVSIGGGSTTGLAKAVALTTDLPIIAVPTTYAGSEATNVWGLTENGRKTTGVDARVLSRAIVYDAMLTLSLPVGISMASGLNALAHCVDSMWAPRTDPIDQAFASEGITAVAAGIRAVIADPGDIGGREQALYGAYLSAVAFASAGSGLHHKICHVLGGMFDLPHAQTHAVVLPYVLALNGPTHPVAERRIARAFDSATAIEGLRQLSDEVGAPRSLREFGMPKAGIPAAVAAVVAGAPSGNPAPVTVETISDLLSRAWEGQDFND